MRKMKRLTADDWNKRFKTATRDYTKNQLRKVFEYEKAIIDGITSAISGTDLYELSGIDEKTANYALELLIKFAPEIVNENPSKRSIFWRSRALTSIRMWSWKDELLKQQDACRRNYRPLVIERDDDGSITAIGFGPSDYDLTPNGLNPYKNDPETICIRKADRELFFRAVSELALEESQNASVRTSISTLILEGEKVGKHNAEFLGIPEGDIAHKVFEVKNFLKRNVAEFCPATAENQEIAKHKSSPRKFKRMTFKKLKESYRQQVEIHPPVTIRDWKVIGSDKKPNQTITSLGMNVEDSAIGELCDIGKVKAVA